MHHHSTATMPVCTPTPACASAPRLWFSDSPAKLQQRSWRRSRQPCDAGALHAPGVPGQCCPGAAPHSQREQGCCKLETVQAATSMQDGVGRTQRQGTIFGRSSKQAEDCVQEQASTGRCSAPACTSPPRCTGRASRVSPMGTSSSATPCWPRPASGRAAGCCSWEAAGARLHSRPSHSTAASAPPPSTRPALPAVLHARSTQCKHGQ